MEVGFVVFEVLFVVFAGFSFLVYAWTLYNLPILFAGVNNFRHSQSHPPKKCSLKGRLPVVSIVVPAKNEGKVIGRLLDSLSLLDYPSGNIQVIIVEDGSSDDTLKICKEHVATEKIEIKVLHRQISNGKPAALNYGIEHSRGEIIGVFDADSVLAPDALGQVCKYFEDPQVAAVQGRTLAINSNENMLTRFVAYEEAFWFEAYLRGKDALNLFVHLKGSCQFIRRASLEELNGFNQDSLSEDMELSARLTEKDLKIKYAPDVQAWQETPASLTHLIKQRTRWFRGTMEVAFKYGKLLAKKNVKSLDAEATLMGPFVLIASLAIYLVSLSSVFLPLYGNPAWFMLSLLTLVATTLTLVVAAATLIFASKRKPLSGLFWLPFLYFYWSLQTIIALYAMLTSLLNTPRKWTRTQKSGVIDNNDFSDKKTLTSKRPAP